MSNAKTEAERNAETIMVTIMSVEAQTDGKVHVRLHQTERTRIGYDVIFPGWQNANTKIVNVEDMPYLDAIVAKWQDEARARYMDAAQGLIAAERAIMQREETETAKRQAEADRAVLDLYRAGKLLQRNDKGQVETLRVTP